MQGFRILVTEIVLKLTVKKELHSYIWHPFNDFSGDPLVVGGKLYRANTDRSNALMKTLGRFLAKLPSLCASKKWWLLDNNLYLICTVHAQGRATGGRTYVKFIGLLWRDSILTTKFGQQKVNFVNIILNLIL